MTASRVLAWGAVSPLGLDERALALAAPGSPARFPGGIVPAWAERGVRRPTAALVSALPRDAFGFLDYALQTCLRSLDSRLPGWERLRVGLAIGTSSGGMAGAERLFESLEGHLAPTNTLLDDAAVLDATYGAGCVRARDTLRLRLAGGGGALTREASVLVACASSTVALGLGHAWLVRGVCDVVLAGGYDGLTLFVTSGFSCLSATTATSPRPFRLERDGLGLSEGAGVIALVRDDVARGFGGAPASPRRAVFVRGFGASSDAVHGTAPDRTGGGVARGAARALAESGLDADALDLVDLHGTATPFNDAAEARALERIGWSFADERHRVHAPKGMLGHALGAAGVLETLGAVAAIERGIFPATAGDGAMDPDAPARLLERSEAGEVKHVLKLSAAFGGANASLVLSSEAGALPAAREIAARWDEREVTIGPAEATPQALADALAIPIERASRLDELGRLVTRAASAALEGTTLGDGHDVALVVETAHATVGRNYLYFQRILDRSAAFAEPRRFPGTSPNFAGGEASLLLGVRGPVFTVGGDPRLATQREVIAEDLVCTGRASICVVVTVEEDSPAARRIEEALPTPADRALGERGSFATARVLRALPVP